ncbi:MAG: hypothetical protein LUH82_00910 [Clostridiales bacterium]|nr:hypothetical protein [Clostridiales bacterium]
MGETSKEQASEFLTYKGKPLVRCGKTIYYGNMSDPYVVCLTVKSEKKLKDISVSEQVLMQLISTDENASPRDRILKKSEKQGLFTALDLGAVWLERELKK